ncbi:hypothetical protein CCHL11_01655 [Colletotrichum chlorophyti]|uniref:Uncharacterized protein n=1 Tax=Colletotrichum chlorophyti TaxID=708187 RepID=A0A1Q8RY11_9PEZI|nr:hypothetical protein CCHL11_01655 [Colletotrichum chlorophyti]
MYVSTRQGGTCAFWSPNPKDVHEMQWKIGPERTGTLIKEKEVVPPAASSKGEDTSHCKDKTKLNINQRDMPGIRNLRSLLRTFKSKKDVLSTNGLEERSSETQRYSWFTNVFGLDTVLSLRESFDQKPIPLPDGCTTPHAIFARKFSLLADSQPLPPSMAHKMMPTADMKARKLLADAANDGLMGPS